MRKIITILGLIVLAPAVKADTIYLKNGSVIKGKVASYAEDQFVVMLNTGSDRMPSRAQIYKDDVSRIDFDAGSISGSGSAPSDPGPSVTGPTVKTVTVETSPKTEPGTGGLTPTPPAGAGSEAPTNAGTQTSPPATEPSQPAPTEPEPPVVKKAKGQVRTATVDVIAKRDWTSSGLIVRRGDTIRVSASGTVTLDPNTGQTSGPEGIDQPDPKKLMADKPTGSLIAVIGADNDDFIFIGRSTEFTAARDGLLFLSVNEGTLSDNSGSFKAMIEVESNRK
jgi:sRNA-binding regulator protein Hfq